MQPRPTPCLINVSEQQAFSPVQQRGMLPIDVEIELTSTYLRIYLELRVVSSDLEDDTIVPVSPLAVACNICAVHE